MIAAGTGLRSPKRGGGLARLGEHLVTTNVIADPPGVANDGLAAEIRGANVLRCRGSIGCEGGDRFIFPQPLNGELPFQCGEWPASGAELVTRWPGGWSPAGEIVEIRLCNRRV
jgi:hypothetical protein